MKINERIEGAAAVLLTLATVGTAWSGYQASRWNGEASKAAAHATAARIESAKAAGLADSLAQIDVATFTSWVDAYAQGQQELADFYFRRFRAEFKPAVAAWIATKPRKNPKAPLTPFAMPQYRLAARAQAARLSDQADATAMVAASYIARSTNYVLGVVLFAAVLFLAGMSARLQTTSVRRLTLAVGLVVFVCTAVWLATSPVSVSI